MEKNLDRHSNKLQHQSMWAFSIQLIFLVITPLTVYSLYASPFQTMI